MKRRLDDITEEQRGLFTPEQAARAGLTEDQRRWRLGTGAWLHAAHGVYRLAGLPTSWRTELQAALLDAGHASLVSHDSAARLHRYPGFSGTPVEILVPYGLDHECTIATVHECRRFDRVP